jgi:hypothetical protein
MCGLFSSKYGKFAVKNVAVFENIWTLDHIA